MEKFTFDVEWIPGIGIGFTNRDGVEMFVDFLEEGIRRRDEISSEFTGVKKIGTCDWSSIGLPENFKPVVKETA